MPPPAGEPAALLRWVVRIVLLLWFVALSALIFLPSWDVLHGTTPPSVDSYTKVVKEVLLPMLTPFFTTFLLYAFGNGAVGIVENYFRLRKGQDIREIHLI